MDALPITIPSWLSDLSLPTAIILFGFALSRGWLYTSSQVVRLLDSSKRVSDLWEKVATERQETIKLLAASTEPIIQGNEAILRTVEDLQRQLQQQRGGRR